MNSKSHQIRGKTKLGLETKSRLQKGEENNEQSVIKFHVIL